MPPALSFLTLDEWQSFVEAQGDSTAFHHRYWIELIAGHYGWETLIAAIQRDGRTMAAIPFVQTKSILGRTKLISLPFTDCVPALGSPDDLAELLTALGQNPRLTKHDCVVVRSNAPFPGTQDLSLWYRHVLDVSKAMADLEKGFSRTLLRNVRKAESSYLSFHRRTDQHAVKCFYKLHVITRRKLGVPVQPKGFFMQLYTKMIATGLGYVGIVEREDRPIAAAVFLTFNKTTIYKYGASDPKHLHTRPNEFLFYHAIRGAGETGDTHFDFGVTAMDNGGLRSFKKKWGPTEEHVHHAYVVGHPPPADTKSHALTIASAVIRHTPKVVCRGLGEVFYRFSQ